MSSQKSIVLKNCKQTLNDWDKLGEDFYNGVYRYRRTPPSSPPEIWWSSSGSSDVDQCLPRRHHKVIMKLDFDSCIVQSSISLHKSRVCMIRSAISKNQCLHNSLSVNVLECPLQDLSSDITQLCKTDDKCNINAEDSDKEDIIQNSPISVSQNFTIGSKDTSPVIGNKNESLHGINNLDYKKLKRNKKRRKVVSCNEQMPSSSPVIGLRKLKINKSFLFNSEIEENVLEIVPNDISQNMDIQHYSQYREKNFEIGTEVDANAVISEKDNDKKHKILEISSPVLGLSVEKKIKCKKRKFVKRQKDNHLNGNVKLQCDSKLVKICKNLFSENCDNIPENVNYDDGVDGLKDIRNNIINSGKSDIEHKRKLKRHEDEPMNENIKFWSNSNLIKIHETQHRETFNNMLENVSNEARIVNSNDTKKRRKSDIESVLSCDDDGVSCDSVIESSVRISSNADIEIVRNEIENELSVIESSVRVSNADVEIVRNKVENEHNQNAESCDKFEILMKSLRTDSDSSISINTDSPVQESKLPQLTIATDQCSIEDKTGNDVSVSNTDLEIEVVSSQEVVQESGEDKLVRVPIASSCEINVISSCSTPSSQKTDEEYMDSAKKKKRMRLNRSGLAARLKKLISRKESSKHMWKHEISLMKPMRSLSKGILLNIISVWKEYSCTLLHCIAASGKFLSAQSSEVDDGESNQNFRLVVVMESLPNFKLKPRSSIQIYPPWQTLNTLDLKLTVIFGVTWIEEVQEYENLELFLKPPQVIETGVYNSLCKCLEGKDSESGCQFEFPHRGLEFLEFLLSLNVPRVVPYDSTDSVCTVVQVEKCKWPIREAGTIAEAVACQGCLLTGDIWLQLCVLSVFHYESRNQASSKNYEKENCDISWSILGCDSAGECCEVILGLATSEADTMQNWSKITTRQAVGHFFKFTGFNVAKRFHKSKNAGFWALMNKFSSQRKEGKGKEDIKCSKLPLNSVEAQESLEEDVHTLEESQTQNKKKIGECQLFLYIFAPGTETWRMEILEGSKPVCLPNSKIYNLADALLMHAQDGGEIGRYTYLAKLIWATDNHLYVSDMSLSNYTTQNYMRISVTPSCFLPSEIISNKVDVILLQDLLLQNGIVSADKFSWIIDMSNAKQREDTHCCPQITDEDIDLLGNLHITAPHLNQSSGTNDLVLLKGTVVYVDEETAFSWPVCRTCDNELLIEIICGQYLCQKCGSSQTCTRMSLEVFVQCQEISDTHKIKVKMQQDSIMKLLPSSQDNSEGYELSSVLNQTVGPLLCIVMKTAANSFFLNEITV